MRRTLLILSGVFVLALLAGGLTEAAMVIGQQRVIVDDTASRVASPTPSATQTPSVTPEATPTTTPTATPLVTPAATPVARTATTNGFVRLRAGASTATAIVMELNGGTVVVLGNYQDAQWQEVTVNGVRGFIYKAYLAY